MDLLIDAKVLSLTENYEHECRYIRNRLSEIDAVLETSKLVLKSFQSPFFRNRYSKQSLVFLARLIREEKSKIESLENEKKRLLFRLEDNHELTAFLLDAQKYLKLTDAQKQNPSLIQEFKEEFMGLKPETIRERHNCDDLISNELEDAAFTETGTISQILPYKRLVYFREKLRQRQGKTRVKIPNFVLTNVSAQLAKNGVRARDATLTQIAKALKETNLGDFRELVPGIARLLNPKINLLDIDSSLEKILVKKFAVLEAGFIRGQQIHGKKFFGRSSMLSVDFCCREICKELKLFPLLKFWKVTKNPKILKSQKETFLKIKEFIK